MLLPRSVFWYVNLVAVDDFDAAISSVTSAVQTVGPAWPAAHHLTAAPGRTSTTCRLEDY
ncbi:hypothetical protein [Parafrankia sp. EUN1f]|uniref:hypothetical protein n=1 Tax=Parafrankia sp. EUN1f TaxID=102897 RepID=UPI0002E56F29|nr:hypothetical protein [Parafrankia sp. EUN1f]